MIDEMEATSKTFTNVMRLVGLILLLMGLMLFMSPLTNMLGYVPVVGLREVTSTTVFIGAVVISLLAYMVIMGIAWVYYRPTVGIALILVATVIFGWLVYREKMRVKRW